MIKQNNNSSSSKHFFKLLLSRKAIFVVSIMLQLLALVGIISGFMSIMAFYWGCILLSLVVVLSILNNKSNPAYKVAWVIPIILFPIFGGLFYLFFGSSKLSRRTRKKMEYMLHRTRQALPTVQGILDEIRELDTSAAQQSSYIQNYAYYPVYHNSYSEYLPNGEIKFERLKEELSKAEKFIFLEYFIIDEGLMWNSVLEILKDKAAQGLDVRVIYDDAGCLKTLPKRYNKILESMGIKCCVFNPMIPVLSSRLNNRDHRKIAVIDGITGFTGGINLADEYINRIEKFGHWKDASIMIKGNAVCALTTMFLSIWNYIKGINENMNSFIQKSDVIAEPGSDGYIQPFGDSPLDDEPVGETVYFNLINKAKKYIYITTPYLIIGSEMAMALCSAAKNGVDVRIITPHHADKWYVHSVTRSYYHSLVENGVKIYEYRPGFIHSKTFVVDDEYGLVGTINMDYRSMFLHFECGVWLYRCKCISDMKKDFDEIMEKSLFISMRDIKMIQWYKVLLRSILRIFAPLM
jgi:Phosphatidylserine/phosphatidylglycerophosphate/cardiolipin synthases and related enzymes